MTPLSCLEMSGTSSSDVAVIFHKNEDIINVAGICTSTQGTSSSSSKKDYYYSNSNNNNNNNNVKEKVTSIIGTTVTISKSFMQYLNNIPVKQEIRELHKQP